MRAKVRNHIIFPIFAALKLIAQKWKNQLLTESIWWTACADSP